MRKKSLLFPLLIDSIESLKLFTSRIKNFKPETYNKFIQNFLNKINTNSSKDVIKNEIKELYNIPLISTYEMYEDILDDKDLEIHSSLPINIYLELDIRLKDVFNAKGSKLNIKYNQNVKCEDDEIELKEIKNRVRCKKCNGDGKVLKNKIKIICSSCKGFRFVRERTCEKCHNNGMIVKENTVQIIIDKNFHLGTIFNFSKLGNYDIINEKFGYLRIKPNIVEDQDLKFLKIVNNRLESEEYLSPSQLALGGNIKVKHARGVCEISINDCTQPGDYRVVDNIGIPDYYDEDEQEVHRSSQIVNFNINLPDVTKNTELKKLYEELQKYENMNEINELNNII